MVVLWSMILAKWTLKLVVHRNEEQINQFRLLAGWRIFVTNLTQDRMTLHQATQYYRDEWLIERGFHRFKKGHIPALPLFLRLPERIKGLMLLLTIALQVLTLMEFVARRELSKKEEVISELVPGNPKMKTARPTAERLLSQFGNLHLLIEEKGKKIFGRNDRRLDLSTKANSVNTATARKHLFPIFQT